MTPLRAVVAVVAAATMASTWSNQVWAVSDPGPNGMSVAESIAVGDQPDWIIVDGAHDQLYVTFGQGNEIAVVDSVTRNVKTRITPDANAEWVERTLLDPKQGWLFAMTQGTGHLTVIDTDSNTIKSRLQVGKGTHSFALDTSRNRLYDFGLDSHVVRTIDTKSLRVIGRHRTPQHAQSMVLDAVHGWLYFDGRTSAGGRITAVDAMTWRTVKVISGIAVGGGLMALDVGADRLFASIVDDKDPGTMSIVDTAHSKVLRNISVGMWPARPVVDERRHRVYLATDSVPDLYVIDTRTNKGVAHVQTNGSTGDPLLADRGARIYSISTTAQTSTLAMIDPKTNSMIGSLPLTFGARSAALDDAHNVMYIASWFTGSLEVVQLPR